MEMRHRVERGQAKPMSRIADVLLGFVANFFDTLGIGSFASTTAWVKFRKLIPDELIPGTLNAGHALPIIMQAIIFTTAIAVAPLTLVSMVAAFVVKSLSMQWLYWLVVVVVLYAAILMLRSALQPQPAPVVAVSNAVQDQVR